VPQPIFNFIQKNGNIDDKEMYQTFNMGMGFAIILSETDAFKAVEILQKYSKTSVKIIGKIEKGTGVKVPRLNLNY